MAGGCAAPAERSASSYEEAAAEAPPQTARASEARAEAKPVAVVEGEPLQWRALRPRLMEQGGAEVLRGLVLQRRLRRRLEQRAWTISAEQRERERDLLARRLDAEDPERAERLLETLRRRRGLGPARFRAMLWRHAALRRLVKGEVELQESEVRQMHRIRYGPRYEPRLLVVDTLTEAERLRRRAKEDDADFATLAARHSTDSSRNRGGLLSPISPADPAYPAALRETLTDLAPGDISAPVSVERGYALLKLVRKIPAKDTSFKSVREPLREEVRRRRERRKMRNRAQRLLEEADVKVLDAKLRRVWSERRDAARSPALPGTR
jgi:hypothetical protein